VAPTEVLRFCEPERLKSESPDGAGYGKRASLLTRVFRRAASDEARSRSEAFSALHSEHATGVYNLALRMVGDREDARDICQEVLIKAFKRLGEPGELDQRAWLYRVTVNACYDHLRSRKRRPSAPWNPDLEPAASVDLYEQAELQQHVNVALVRVPPAQRAALLLRDVHGFHTDEVAAALGVQSNSVEVTLSRARKSFRRHFSEVSGSFAASIPGGAKAGGPVPEAGSRLGGMAIIVGLPALALKAVPLPAGLDASSLLASLPTGIGAGVGGGAVAGALTKIAAALSTKAAAVAIGATVVAGGVGGVYSAERSARSVSHGLSRAAAAPAKTGSATPRPGKKPSGIAATGPATPAAAPTTAAPSPSPSATPTPSAEPTPLVVGESGGSSTPSATPSPSPTPSDSPTAEPSPSATPTATPTPSPSSSTTPTPSVTPSAEPTPSPAP
jgi:RNA polymerase sigma factor (sigma-70 family)